MSEHTGTDPNSGTAPGAGTDGTGGAGQNSTGQERAGVVPMTSPTPLRPEELARVVARDIPAGSYVNLGIGQQTPPVASVLVTACSVAKADIWEVSKVNLWFIAVLVSMLLLVTYVPVVPMALVEVLYR